MRQVPSPWILLRLLLMAVRSLRALILLLWVLAWRNLVPLLREVLVRLVRLAVVGFLAIILLVDHLVDHPVVVLVAVPAVNLMDDRTIRL